MKKSANTKSGEDGVAAVEGYLAAVPEPARSTLEKIRTAIRAAAPKEATEGLSYGMPAFRYKGPIAGYAAFKNHCSYFPMGGGWVEKFEKELAGYETSKGGIRFPVDKPLPAALVRKLVKAHVAVNELKGKA